MQRSQIKPHQGHLLGAILLICGACLGGGVLSLSLLKNVYGLMQTSIALLVCWFFAVCSGLLFLEANLWVGSGKHMIAISQKLLNPFSRFILILSYLLICYVTLILFIANGAELFLSDVSANALAFNRNFTCLLLGLFLGSFIYLGTLSISRINALLIALALCLGFVFMSQTISQIHFKNIVANSAFAFLSIPFFFSAFSFQTMIPTLSSYLNGHIKSLRLAIIIGPACALLIYVIWSMWLAQGNFLNQSLMTGVSSFFIFLILISAFLGISAGLFDFLAEALKESKRGWHKLLLTLLICIPVVIGAIFFSNFFNKIFEMIIVRYVAPLLYGLIPVLLVYKRRRSIAEQRQAAFKRKWDLVVLFLWSCFVILSSFILN